MNKPYGVPLRRPREGTGQCPYSLEEVLAPLADRLGVGGLSSVKTVEPNASGVCLLASDHGSMDRIRKSQTVNTSLGVPTYTFWAVTLGRPHPDALSETVGLGSLTHQDVPGKFVSTRDDARACKFHE